MPIAIVDDYEMARYLVFAFLFLASIVALLAVFLVLSIGPSDEDGVESR